MNVPPKALTISTPTGFLSLWILDLRFTWFLMILLSILPSLLFSSALLPMLFFVLALLFVIPAFAVIRLFTYKPVRIPELNYLLVQPRVSFSLIDGKPVLEISAATVGLAHFAYDFAAKVWNLNT